MVALPVSILYPFFREKSMSPSKEGDIFYSTVTLFARFLGLSTSRPLATDT